MKRKKRGSPKIGTDAMAELEEALAKESDRALPLVACECLDALLEGLLAARFKAEGLNKDDRKWLLGGWNSLLGSFASKIKICRAFGVIPKAQCDALDSLRDLRNHCAHFLGVASLTDKECAGCVSALSEFVGGDKRVRQKDARHVVAFAAGALAGFITGLEVARFDREENNGTPPARKPLDDSLGLDRPTVP